MFERFTEGARRAIFFARYEASQYGSPRIETEHLLLGLLRESRNLPKFPGPDAVQSIRKELESRITVRERISESVEMPLSDECKRVLNRALKEAENLGSKSVAAEHLTLALLGETGSLGARILSQQGMRPDSWREALAQRQDKPAASPAGASKLRGKLIVLEGIDGSGKGTQLELLASALAERQIPHATVSFPKYSGFFGQMIAKFLNGGFGPLESVAAHFAALLYAGDRLESKSELEAALAAGQIVLADRYIPSNLAHQGARVPPERRDEFLAWVRRLEYEIYGLPQEDAVIYLRVPAEQAQQLVAAKAPREYTPHSRDIQESSRAHLESALRIYDELARQPNWATIECMDRRTGQLRSPAEIHAQVLAVLRDAASP